MQRIIDKRLTQKKAAEILEITDRQVRRLLKNYKAGGAQALQSKHRGRKGNRTIDPAIRKQATNLIIQNYNDFGPTLAHEKLVEVHGLNLSVETVRKWMIESEIWQTKSQQAKRAYQPRNRRPCVGDLVQIDGSDHEWFEKRAPRCTLLVYIDDATSRLMKLHFCPS